MNAYKTLLAGALLFAVCAPAAAQNDLRLLRCFCIQHTGEIPPYFLGKMTLPECAAAETSQFGERVILDFGLLNCEELQFCLTPPGPEVREREAALEKLEKARQKVAACCPAGKGSEACDETCVKKKEPKFYKLKAKSDALEAEARAVEDSCILAKSRPVKAAPEAKPKVLKAPPAVKPVSPAPPQLAPAPKD
jgi:hypothetical protein